MIRPLLTLGFLLAATPASANLSSQRLSGQDAKLVRQALHELGSHERARGPKQVVSLSRLDCRVDRFQPLPSYQCKVPESRGAKARRVVELLVKAHVPAVSGWGVQAWELREVRCETANGRTSCQFQG